MEEDKFIRKKRTYVVAISVMYIFLLLTMQAQSAHAEDSDDFVDDSHPNATLVISSEKLLNNIEMINPKIRKIGKLNQGVITIKNLKKNRYSLEYKIDWQTIDGIPTLDESVWQRFVLSPFELKTFTSIGKDRNSEKIVVTVRFPDDAFIELDNGE